MHGNQSWLGQIYLLLYFSKAASPARQIIIPNKLRVLQYFSTQGSDLPLASSLLSCEQICANNKSMKSLLGFQFYLGLLLIWD